MVQNHMDQLLILLKRGGCYLTLFFECSLTWTFVFKNLCVRPWTYGDRSFIKTAGDVLGTCLLFRCILIF